MLICIFVLVDLVDPNEGSWPVGVYFQTAAGQGHSSIYLAANSMMCQCCVLVAGCSTNY